MAVKRAQERFVFELSESVVWSCEFCLPGGWSWAPVAGGVFSGLGSRSVDGVSSGFASVSGALPSSSAASG